VIIVSPSTRSVAVRAVFRAPRAQGVTRVALALLVGTLIAGCAARRAAPIEERGPGPRPPGATAPLPPAGAPAGTAAAPEAAARPGEAPVVATYTVKRGDTLYQIALDNGLDYRELAAWNGIENVNLIHVGEVLRLAAPGSAVAGATPATAPGTTTMSDGVTTAPLRTVPPVEARASPPGAPGAVASPGTGSATPGTSAAAGAQGNLKTSPKAIKEPYSDQAVRDLTLAASAGPAPPAESPRPGAPRADSARPEPTRPAPADGDDDDRLDWRWPAKGRVVAGFSETANLKGIDIAGTAGEPVLASAPGKVVYAGSGLRGYGKLIIIKHNKTYLSAYAHNREILVKEGQQVARGQKIAEMGNSDADSVKLHFEIRRLGKPMDPARYLPPA
jgi:lipoprotein NlpD